MKSTALTEFALCLLLALPLWGCTSASVGPTPTATPAPTATPQPVPLRYIGHSCTLVIAPDGTRIVGDPYGASRPEGLPAFPKDIEAEVVMIGLRQPVMCTRRLDPSREPPSAQKAPAKRFCLWCPGCCLVERSTICFRLLARKEIR
jgi:hypothetical protein